MTRWGWAPASRRGCLEQEDARFPGTARAGTSPSPVGALAWPPHLPCHSLAKSPLCAWPGRWGAEARRALMCHFARRHGSWAQRAGTSGTRAVRQLQRRPRLTSQHGAALFSPGEAGTAPGARPPLGYVPDEAHGEQRGRGPHVIQESRCCPRDGEGAGGGGQGDPGGGPRGCTTTKPPTPASLEPSKKLV